MTSTGFRTETAASTPSETAGAAQGTAETPVIGKPQEGTAADTQTNTETKSTQPQKGLI